LEKTLSIPKSQITWIPREFLKAGFKGKVPYKMDAATIILIHPDASLENIETSLGILLDDIRLRIKMREEKEASAKDA